MPERWELVRHWRERASDLRHLAEDVAVPSARHGIEHAAKNYERMADELERALIEQKPESSIAT